MKQPITGYHTDDEGHWVAELACGHNQQVRHDPPLVSRPWVTTPEGRASFLGFGLNCLRCDLNEPPTRPPSPPPFPSRPPSGS
ncbi:MAG: DUF3565 domain-containing protein [Gemmatimonadaceae bacterium]